MIHAVRQIFGFLISFSKAPHGWDFLIKKSFGGTKLVNGFEKSKPIQSCARVSDWPISIHNWVYIFLSVEFSIYVLTF